MMVGVMEVLAAALIVSLANDALAARPGYGPVDVPPGFAVQMQSRAVDMGVDFNITEGQAIGTTVGVIPRKLGFTYRFNEPPKEFTLDPYTGEIKTSAVLDRESVENDRYDLVVLSSQPTYPIEVRIAVTDINDNSPQFPEPSIAVAFSESAAAGTRLLLDAATDRDLGVNGIANDYRIIDGDSEGKFRLNLTANPSGQTSYLHLETTGKLDRESKDHYILNISARDGGSPPKYGYLQVNVTILDVNDNPPIFDQSDFSVSLNESVGPGTRVLKVTATDSDLGENGKISYRLSESEQQFTVDPVSGVISTAAPLDCQKYCNNTTCNRTCVLTVIAFDHGSPRQDARSYVTVNLIDANDHDPVITFIYVPSTANFATVDENAKNGSVVAAITVVDVDEGLNGKTSVQIVSGNELNHFRLETSSSVYIVHVNGVLDREEISKYNLTVVATDKGSPTRTATAFLIIHVNDVNDHEPVFEKSEYSAILSELAPKGTYVAGIVASDEDSGVNAEIYYSFQNGNEHAWFDIDSASGLVTTQTLLDREIQGTVELNVSARDGGPNPKWAFTQLKVTILDENDEAPKFSKDTYQVNLSENDPEGSIIVYLTASDHDQGTNGSVTYSLHPEIDQEYPKTFAIDSSSGILRTLTKLDRETIPDYEIRVIARDQGFPQQSSTATVLLSVLDINDNNPEFYPQQYYITISDDLSKGSSIVKVNATDRDEGENAVVTYNLENGGDGFFTIDRWTGVIKLNSDLHHAQKPLYRLIISSSDRDGRKAQEDAVVEIIKRSFKKELQFNSYGGYEFQIVEDDSTAKLNLGRHVGTVQVQSSLENVKYAIIYGDENRVFKIDERTGSIETAAEIDREMQLLYNLKIVAKSGLAFGITSVNISVLDVNDNSPIFMYEADEIHIPENMAVGQEVYFARARDRDSGVNSSVTYSLTYTIDATFRISETTGVIYLNKPIRVEPGTAIPIEVTARDGGKPPLSSNHSTSIIIDDVNDHTPVFDHTSYETSLLESTLVNTRFFALSASDGDMGINGKISYIIEEGNGDNRFGIFPDGYLYVRSPLDREDKDYYALTMTAIDHGIEPRYSQVPVVIHILDENDNVPKFTNETFSFSIRENEMPDTFVGKLTAVDGDIGRNAELTFSLSSDNKYFAIDSKKGFIKTRRSFDRESLVENTGQNYMTMKVTVTDSGQIKLQDSVDVTVYIVDVNDNAPAFIGLPYKVQISEGASMGTPVLRAMTTDADEGLNGDIFYKLIGGDDTGRFIIDEATGQLSILKMLDREILDHYSITILAHDIGQELQLSSTTTVSINVIDENDNAPEFTQTESRISVIETEPINKNIIQFHATDVDLGINAEITYSITSGNRRDTFYIEPLTGILYLHKQLDYEDLAQYFLNITASDGGNPRLHTTTILTVSVIDANDNPPIFSNTAIVRQIREGIPTYTPIVTVTAEDPDSGMNGKVYYAISHQDPNNHKRHFDINNITGVIHTLLPIDRESIDTFRLTIVAYDRAEPKSSRLSAEKLVTVIVEDINDNSPIFVSMNAAVIPAEKLKQGIGRDELLIMNVNARDLDSGSNGLVTYELQTENDIFHLHRSTGALTLRGMSYSVEPYWNLHVKAIDEAVQSEQRSTETYLTIIKGGSDSEGIIWSIPSSTSVPENEPAGTNVTVVNGQLPGTILEYFITNVTAMGQQADRLFDIDPRLGIIFTAVPLDHESGNGAFEVEICAVAVNGRTRTFKTKVLIEVLDKNDSPPVFKNVPLFYTASEDLAPGQPIATIEADDPDTIGHIMYSIESEEPTPFSLDETTGTLTLKDPLDRETKADYELVIRASDDIQFTDVTVTIQVLDTNDNPPVFTESAYSLDVAEGALRGSRVGALSARDADAGLNARLSYFLVSDWANDVFSLNPHTGLITLTAKLDYEEVQHYILVAAAQDGGQPALSATVAVYVNVLDRNDNAPVFDPVAYSAELLESAPLHTPVLAVSATDLDSGENGRVVYSIASGDDDHDFTVNDNGTVMTARPLDREQRALYSLLVSARDCAEPPADRLSSTVQVTIQLKDVNDMAPEFVSSNETSVIENVALNTVIMTIKAVDKDEGRNGYIEYFLAPDPAIDGLFSLGAVDGLLRASGKLDREFKSSYVLSITAKDRGDEPMMTNTDIYVTILDENDNSPVFDYRQYSAAVPENASIGASVLQVAATDIDEGPNGRVRYSIASGDENRDFSISEDTGVVRVAKNLNYERKSRYNLMVRAEDCSQDDVRHDTAVLTISIQDINDNPPTFLDSPYLAFVMENVIPPNGGYVITVKAYDADTPPFNNQVRYFIKEGDADLFRVNASTGQLSLTRTLDRETQAEYTLTLVAMDTGSPPLTGSGTVRIIVRDINDNSPEFERQAYRATVNENLPYGTTIISPKATDKDLGNNAKIRYSLLGDKVERFHINQDTGVITSATILDREENSFYTMTIMAQDSSTTDPRATTANLTIEVLDINDNTPVFANPNNNIIIPESTDFGDFVFGARAVDSDIGLNSKIKYKISGEHASLFIIDEDTGVIKAKEPLFKHALNFDYSFKLTITASDCGNIPRQNSSELIVLMKPTQYFPNFINLSKMYFTLRENVTEGEMVTKLSAKSPKMGPAGNLQYGIAGGNVGDALRIDSIGGEIYVTGQGLDYETIPVYEAWFEVIDSDFPPLRSVLELKINVTDANDNPPVMEKALYNTSVLEEEPPPVLIIQITAKDDDSNENGEVSYELLNDYDGEFEIDSSNGEIYSTSRLDRETIPVYELIVKAIDNGCPKLTGTATVLVNLLDINDNPPRFTRLFSVNVTENAEFGSFVIKVTSSDQDLGANANATYSFTENPGEKFLIDSETGNVTVAGALDREQQDEYILKVVAVDGAWRAETPLTITIQDQNDNAPEFEHSFYSFNFPELQDNVTFVGQVIATDRDKQGPNSVISYSLQHPSELFTVDPASGEIFSKTSIRYKQTSLEPSPENIYSITVLATDNGKPPMSSECLVTINIVDANNNAPKFVTKEYLSPVPFESIAGEMIVQVAAKDEYDSGINAEIDYIIVGGNATDHFAIDKISGRVTLTNTFSDVGKTYQLVVKAIDRGVPPQSDEAVITFVVTGENMHSPVFAIVSYQVLVPENVEIGREIMNVSAVDEDDGPNGIVRYKISGGNERKEFDVHPISGVIRNLQSLDFDTIVEYHLNISATDLGFEPKEATAMVTITLTDINDNAPFFNQTKYVAYLPENSEPNSLVCKITAYDKDSPINAIIRYSIMESSSKRLFRIDNETGEIYSKVSFDFEESNLYILNIQAANPDSSMRNQTKIIVHITGVNEYYPKFIQSAFHFDVSESAEIGTHVGVIQATDQDSGDDGKVYYLFVGSSNDKGFSINPQTGVIRVSRSLDRETQNRVVLTVLAKNFGGIRGNDTDEAQVIISIQDGNDPPEFLQKIYETTVSEGARIGEVVTHLKAVDKDVRPQNNQFGYSIIGGNSDHAFKIDPQSGELEIARKLDRESIPLYSLIVGAIDTGVPPQTGTATVRITLTDVNDNGPIFDPPEVVGYVSENEPPNTSVMTLTAKDPDLPPNGAPFSYTLVGGIHREMITIEKHTGIVRTTQSVDREINPELDILVEVQDSGVPRQRTRHSIKIIIIDKNDSPSTPRSVHILVYSFNNLLPRGKIADVKPNDPDSSGDYYCKIIKDNNSEPEVLTIRRACDLYTSDVKSGQGYSLSVSGNDGKHPDVISTVTVEFLSFDNSTVDESVTILVNGITSSRFLTKYYNSLMDIIKADFDSNDSVYLYSINEVKNGIQLMISLRQGAIIRSKTYVINYLKRKEMEINALLQTNIILPYIPCQYHSCNNDGLCSDSISVHQDTRVTESQTLIITSPVVNHDYTCQCADGFTGSKCEKQQDPCAPNPCLSEGKCHKQGLDFYCTCPISKEGKLCELDRNDVCTENPCKNGGSCRQSADRTSYFCLCRRGYRGNDCEAVVDSCRPNPCLNDGACISLKPGYKCSCQDGRYGKHCELSTYGFNELSYMTFPALDSSTNDISIVFATTKSDSLLIYNYGQQSGGRSDFVAVELHDGKAIFSFGGARTPITSVVVPGQTGNLADGNWHKVTATRNGRVVSLSVSDCVDHGDVCSECRPGDPACYADYTGQSGTLNFDGQRLLVGGLEEANPILERPGQIHSDDFVGCLHSVSINGRTLNLSNPMSSRGIDPVCKRSENGPCSSALNSCGGYQCIDKWRSASCRCGASLISPNCQSALQSVSVSEGGHIEYIISQKHKRMQLLESIYGGTTLWMESRNSVPISLTSNLSSSQSVPAKSISLLFRTIRKNGIILYAGTDKQYTIIKLIEGNIFYISKQTTVVNITMKHDGDIADGNWHNITLYSHNRGVYVLVDDKKIGEELDSVVVHDFLDPELRIISLGGVRETLYREANLLNFEGCLANFSINNEIQPFNGSGSIFSEVQHIGQTYYECHGPIGVGNVQAPDPLSIGITLVIVFFVILIVAILVSFVVFRLRKQNKEKSNSSNKIPGLHTKQNGNAMIGGPNLGSLGNDGMMNRALQSNETNVSGFISDNGDMLRNVGGHHIVGPELISKKYKEREIIGTEHQRSQRPDIIEREVVGKSPALREDHHPPPLPTSNTSHHMHDHTSGMDLNSDIPEHYDLENASSIAPSDIDIVYHYKGYREAAGVRKYKATPPPVATYHHKHQPAQHRHSPHHVSGFPGRVPPQPSQLPTAPRQHQTTPLARLSPSSELSSQQPRILTLHDISGKPLQSALLATTSSSGGVGKDVLHSNSERSINSPVMSQLSGQSSSASRKTPGAPPQGPPVGSVGTGAMGLTAGEIERLNARQRSSSLVSTLDAVSSSSEAPRVGSPSHHMSHRHHSPPEDNDGSTSTDESGNDSFTCSEIEYDNNSVNGDKYSKADEDDCRPNTSGNNSTGKPPPMMPPPYDAFDSSFRGSLSTLVASDDELSANIGSALYRQANGSPTAPTALGWDYLLNWGPNFESLIGVFKDIAELPDSMNGRVTNALRLPSGGNKPSEEYV